MASKRPYIRSHYRRNRSQINELGYALHHCWDLTALQTSKLTQLPNVAQRALKEMPDLELAKALRKELIACAEQITQRPLNSIEEIVSAIENEKLDLSSQELAKIQKNIDIPFQRNKIDLARYYAISLVMQGIDHQTIADFLNVDLRTVANYIAKAKESIWLILNSRSMFVKTL